MKTVPAIYLATTIFAAVTISIVAMPVAHDGGSDLGISKNPHRFSKFSPSGKPADASVISAIMPLQQAYTYTGNDQSYIWQNTPDYSYTVNQRHPDWYRNYQYDYQNGMPYSNNNEWGW